METGFYNLEDLPHVYAMIRDQCEFLYPRVRYKPLVIPPVAVDEVHGEIREEDKQWSEEVLLRGYAVPAEQMFPLTIFGTEELRDLVLQVSVPSLIDADLATQDSTTYQVTLLVKPGDHFWWSEVEYDVLVWKIVGTFANTDVPTHFAASAEKVRRISTVYEGV